MVQYIAICTKRFLREICRVGRKKIFPTLCFLTLVLLTSCGTLTDLMIGSKAGEGGNETSGIAEETTVHSPASDVSVSREAPIDISDIVDIAMPSVVSINVTSQFEYNDVYGRKHEKQVESAGSGVLIEDREQEYLIVTNHHVVENAEKIVVQFTDGSTAEAEILGMDSGRDIAVISVDKEELEDGIRHNIAPAEIGNSDLLKVGQSVVAIGNALGYGPSVTVGYISALNRTMQFQNAETGRVSEIRNLIQTDAAINPGNSGGALFDLQGKLIGINESKKVEESVEGMGYAIPISSIRDLISTLSAQRRQVPKELRGYIGIEGQSVGVLASEFFFVPSGVYVCRILEGGAADGSGLQENDVITHLNGMAVNDLGELLEKLSWYETGEAVKLTAARPFKEGYQEFEIWIFLKARGEL